MLKVFKGIVDLHECCLSDVETRPTSYIYDACVHVAMDCEVCVANSANLKKLECMFGWVHLDQRAPLLAI